MSVATRHFSGILRLTAAALVAATGIALPAAPAAQAHPLGNFSVNRYARIELTGGTAQIHYVVDMAEIPTFLELPLIDSDQDGRLSDDEKRRYGTDKAERLRAGLTLTVNGDQAPLALGPTRISTLPGQGGLETLRFETLFVAQHAAATWQARFVDNNEPNRQGWREIIVQGAEGASLIQSSVPQHDLSAALTQYPDPDAQNALNVREAQFVATFATGAQAGGGQLPALATGSVERGMGSLPMPLPLSTDMTLATMLLALAAAVVLGAVHALSPGHGKSVVAAYLVGSRGTVRQAMFLGLTVTVTHTIGVYALGVVTLVASAWILPQQLYPVLGLVSGVMVLLVGLSLLRTRLVSALRSPAGGMHSSHRHEPGHDGPTAEHHRSRREHPTHSHEDHPHGHDGEHGHSHAPLSADGSPLGMRGLLALGVSGGLVPCLSALVVMLSAIALHQTGLGLLLIVAFSLGLAGVITGMGVLLVLTRDRIGRLQLRLPDRVLQPVLRTVPVVAALVVVAVGVVMTLRGVTEL